MKGFIAFLLLLLLNLYSEAQPSFSVAISRNRTLEEWENLGFGAFVHFNDNTFIGKELSKNNDVRIFNPAILDFDGMMAVFKKAGIKYAVLTTRHTSGFCLWDSKTTRFDVASSPFKKDVVELFVKACRKYKIKPCIYYCFWGNKAWNPANWNPTIAEELKSSSVREITMAQLTELSQNYGPVYEFWLDMFLWADTTIKKQEVYNLLKHQNPKTIVHFNQHVQDGQKIKYFPTDIMNGEERIPPAKGHQKYYMVDGKSYYIPFEYEITSQRCDGRSLGNGLMQGSAWFTYSDSHFYPVDSLYRYIKMSFDRGGSNVLLSTAPDKTGIYKKSDADSLIRLGKLIYGNKFYK